MAEGHIRVLLAEDSPTVRRYLYQLISETPNLMVVGEARDGKEAQEMALALKPDVISMDIRMPGVDGLEAARWIMSRSPTPIVMVSGLLDEDIDLSFKALQVGALAVVEKPPSRHDPDFPAKSKQLTTTLAAMAGVRVIRRWDAPGIGLAAGEEPLSLRKNGRKQPEVLVVGASAGGPGALNTLLSGLPRDFPLPVVVVQHLPDEFINGLARWLNDVSPLKVRMAAEGDVLEGGTVYIAPGTSHLTVYRKRGRLVTRMLTERGEHRYQPSINVLFESAAQVCGGAAVGALLTGMGDDGADGLLAIRQAGGYTFAQDRDSCTVFGMPAVAIERGAAENVLSIEQLAAAFMNLL